MSCSVSDSSREVHEDLQPGEPHAPHWSLEWMPPVARTHASGLPV